MGSVTSYKVISDFRLDVFVTGDATLSSQRFINTDPRFFSVLSGVLDFIEYKNIPNKILFGSILIRKHFNKLWAIYGH